MDKRTAGIVSTLVGASLWGFSGTCSQFLMANYAVSTLFLTMMRMLGSGALFLAVIAVRHPGQLSRIARDRASLRQFALFGIVGLYFCQVTYVIAISFTNAGTATVMQSLNIVMIMVVICVTMRRPPRPVELAGLILALTATVLIATQGDLSTLSMPAMGLFWGIVTAAAAACYSLLPRPLYPKWGSFTTVGVGMVVGGVAAACIWGLALAFPQVDAVASAGNAAGSQLIPHLDAFGIATLLVVIVVGTFTAFYLYLHGLSLVGAVQGSQLGAIEPVSATVCSALITSTAFSAFDWIGLVLMVATIILVAAGSRQEA